MSKGPAIGGPANGQILEGEGNWLEVRNREPLETILVRSGSGRAMKEKIYCIQETISEG